MVKRLNAGAALRAHWPEYLIEAWGLGTFMLVAGACVTLLEATDYPLRAWLRTPICVAP